MLIVTKYSSFYEFSFSVQRIASNLLWDFYPSDATNDLNCSFSIMYSYMRVIAQMKIDTSCLINNILIHTRVRNYWLSMMNSNLYTPI